MNHMSWGASPWSFSYATPLVLFKPSGSACPPSHQGNSTDEQAAPRPGKSLCSERCAAALAHASGCILLRSSSSDGGVYCAVPSGSRTAAPGNSIEPGGYRDGCYQRSRQLAPWTGPARPAQSIRRTAQEVSGRLDSRSGYELSRRPTAGDGRRQDCSSP
ncbi:hypothetical protein L226DRAFT_45179 [Lentinus tigrinus ALCF2SS1-7]|uniref:uncharacterized protein n=1 Tax=Lentinus tigrinus ALCF2SS1-7 TaxID=1328758 RepID=UPI001165F63B|nr:hypothetical protein L226DRAFT_45179 [Lentinus tigrinus ALCF2SS1-7]